eukprot:10793505-Alexandrium_andersonii.AAC.1
MTTHWTGSMPSIWRMAVACGSSMPAAFATMTCTSMSGLACRAIHATAGKAWKWQDSRPARPSLP